jgi:hypothetical protein
MPVGQAGLDLLSSGQAEPVGWQAGQSTSAQQGWAGQQAQ